MPEPTGLLVGTPLLIAGFPLLLVALSRGRQASEEKADPNWSPSPESLPDAGRVMYRVDTSLDEPIRTSILCGACGEGGVGRWEKATALHLRGLWNTSLE